LAVVSAGAAAVAARPTAAVRTVIAETVAARSRVAEQAEVEAAVAEAALFDQVGRRTGVVAVGETAAAAAAVALTLVAARQRLAGIACLRQTDTAALLLGKHVAGEAQSAVAEGALLGQAPTIRAGFLHRGRAAGGLAKAAAARINLGRAADRFAARSRARFCARIGAD